jgi:futalosine hydrolase
MIALLAAVPEETTLVRAALQNVTEKSVMGVPLMTGTISGRKITLAHSGIGKAAAAATTISLLSNGQPEALLLFGCGGAYPGAELELGDLAIASGEIFGDDGVATPAGFQDLAQIKLPMRRNPKEIYNTWPVDSKLLDWAAPILQAYASENKIKARSGPFVTVSTCTGSTDTATAIAQRTRGLCENMEGAAVALACQQLSTPLLEIRGISNLVEDRDPGRWNLPAGMAAAQYAILDLLKSWPEQQPQ